MPKQPESRQYELIRHHLMAAWVAGWYAGRNGVRTDDGKRAYADQVAPLFERELEEDADFASPTVEHDVERYLLTPAGDAVARAITRNKQMEPFCHTCALPKRAHEPAVGITSHEFRESAACVVTGPLREMR